MWSTPSQTFSETKVPFSKWEGAGNHFILIDNRDISYPLPTPSAIQRFCHPIYGIGADGVLFLEPSCRGTARMRIFNADGSEAEMCGNGLRCVAAYLGQPSCCIESLSGLHPCALRPGGVLTELGMPHFGPSFEGFTLINSGVPHAVQKGKFRQKLAARIEKERCSNVTFYEPIPGGIAVSTWERGVGVTQACGTGIVAAIAHVLQGDGALRARARSGDWFDGKIVQGIAFLEGPVHYVFSGTITWNCPQSS